MLFQVARSGGHTFHEPEAAAKAEEKQAADEPKSQLSIADYSILLITVTLIID